MISVKAQVILEKECARSGKFVVLLGMSRLFSSFIQLLMETKIPVNLNTKIYATFFYFWELRFCKR